jgi:hypothetical protein
MNNIRCAQCGLVNWSSEIECKRCQALLTVQDLKAQQLAFIMPEPQPFFSRGLQLLTGLLGLATVFVVLSRLIGLERETAIMVALPFMLAGLALLFASHIWLLVRIFQQSIGWGLGSLFVPLVGLIAVFMFWENTRRSFLAQWICTGIILATYFMVPAAV